MTRRLLTLALGAAALLAAAAAVGRVLAGRRSWGDDAADDVGIATVFGGVQRSLRATGLRRLRASAWLGGIDLDLREVTLSPDGADIDLQAVMGGVKVTLPSGWRVEVERDVDSGGVEARVPDPSHVPPGAPEARIVAHARYGGVLITAQPY